MKIVSSVLDASALLAFLKGEPGSREVDDLLHAAQSGKAEVGMNQINLGEVYYILARTLSPETADSFFQDTLPLLPIRRTANSIDDVISAAKLTNRTGLHYMDSFAAITAKNKKAFLLTSDRDFEKVADEIEIRWFR